ncbi:MAG TPA: hypothetical protein VML55_07120 [Planctomycetaceae bacterium]|nr:hypothetical protein [Planctomycetaceae bacterium]
MTASELYEQAVRSLPPTERLKLARLILDELQSYAIVEYSDDWSDEDMRDVTRYSFERAAQSFEEDSHG